MNQIKDKSIKLFISILGVITLSYTISVLLKISLPNESIDYLKNDINIKTQQYNQLFKEKIKETKKRVEKKKIIVPERTLKQFTLKGIYYYEDNKGWIILENQNKETKIVESEEQISGYTLKDLFKNYVVFEKNNKEYKLELEKQTKGEKELVRFFSKEEPKQKKEELILVKKNDLNNYVKNIEKVWKEISIEELRTNGEIQGFEIKKIKKNSKLSQMGLEKGDIIKSVNNKELKSYKDAFNVYKNIKKIKYLNIEILRNNKIMEINYEIN